jgi:Uma2 family endonuclease
MPGTAVKVGPADHGRRMSLEEFGSAEGQSGYLYELSRGVVTVVDVPNPRHFAQLNAIRRQLFSYDLAHPNVIYGVGGGGECKILLATEEGESERHPDVAVYKTPPPDDDVWATWIPDLVMEIVSPGSEDRDYVEKRAEYLRFGVREYWIIDSTRGEVLVLRRRGGQWTERVVRPPQTCTTRLLPGFELDCAAVFEAADAVGP